MALYVILHFNTSLKLTAILGYYVIGGVILIITILISVFHTQIVHALTPATNWMHNLSVGWLIPIAVLFIISFPPVSTSTSTLLTYPNLICLPSPRSALRSRNRCDTLWLGVGALGRFRYCGGRHVTRRTRQLLVRPYRLIRLSGT